MNKKMRSGTCRDEALHLYEKGLYEDALRKINKAISFNLNSYENYNLRADIYQALGRYEDALNDVRRCKDYDDINAYELIVFIQKETWLSKKLGLKSEYTKYEGDDSDYDYVQWDD